MDRLSKRYENGVAYIPGYPQTHGLLAIDKLAHFEDLQEQGRLIELPCAVGDILHDNVTSYMVEEFVIKEEYKSIIVYTFKKIELASRRYYSYSFDDLGKTVFLAKSEAEKELKRIKG